MDTMLIKITFISGLKDVVKNELLQHKDVSIEILQISTDTAYISCKAITIVFELRSVINAYVIHKDNTFNPHFLSKHKSIVGELISKVLTFHGLHYFHTFKLSCAGSESNEVKSIKKFIATTYKVVESEEADLEIYIGKVGQEWEVGVRVTKRPLSNRIYQIEHLKGGINPTIAYAINALCDIDHVDSYLNVFSGSGTLLIEAGLSNKTLQLSGFDIDGRRNAAAIKNIKKAHLIKSIRLQTADIYDKPNIGIFDVITTDLPFGMQIGEDKDLPNLYQACIHYCETKLTPTGKVAIYTAKPELLVDILADSKFIIDQSLELKIPTTVSPSIYLHPKIFICIYETPRGKPTGYHQERWSSENNVSCLFSAFP